MVSGAGRSCEPHVRHMDDRVGAAAGETEHEVPTVSRTYDEKGDGPSRESRVASKTLVLATRDS